MDSHNCIQNTSSCEFHPEADRGCRAASHTVINPVTPTTLWEANRAQGSGHVYVNAKSVNPIRLGQASEAEVDYGKYLS